MAIPPDRPDFTALATPSDHKALKRLAGGRWRHVQALGRAAHAAGAVHLVEEAQQVQVEVFDMHGVHVA